MARRTLSGFPKRVPAAPLRARPGPHLLLMAFQFSVSAQPARMRSSTMRRFIRGVITGEPSASRAPRTRSQARVTERIIRPSEPLHPMRPAPQKPLLRTAWSS